MQFTRAKARQTSIIEFRHADGTLQGGAVNGTRTDSFSVTSYPRYGDTTPRRFRYEEVAEVVKIIPRSYVPLETFGRLMSGGR